MNLLIESYRYEIKLPFIHPELVNPDEWCVYKNVWPVNLEKNTLALIGFTRVLGPALPVVELQARWSIQVFKVC